LDFSFSTSSSQDIPRFKIIVFRPPKKIRKRGFSLIANGICECFFLYIEDFNSSIFASFVKNELPAAKYLSWGSNLTEWILTSGSPYVK